MSYSFINDGAKRLRPYRPGLTVERAKRKYLRDNFVKLASNENAYGPSPRVGACLAQAPPFERYPDPDQTKITEDLADFHQVEPDHLAIGAGSSELLDRLARLVLCQGRNAVFSQYAFSLYQQYTRCYNAETRCVSAFSPEHPRVLGHDLKAMAQAVDRHTAIVFIASPNNPTGTWNEAEELEDFLAAVPERTLVVIDQAYAEYATTLAPDYPELRHWYRRYPNLVVTRTFSKIYALASLRIGYAIARPELIQWLKNIRLPFNVGQLAQEAARLALDDQDHARECARINAEQMRVYYDGLTRLGLSYIPSAGNFVCFSLPKDGNVIYERMMKRGVIGRTLAEYGLRDYLRLSLGTAPENRLALTALEQSLSDVG